MCCCCTIIILHCPENTRNIKNNCSESARNVENKMLENIIINLYISTYKLYINLYKTNAINCAQLDFFIIIFFRKGTDNTLLFFFLLTSHFTICCWRFFLVLGGSNQIRLPTIADSPDPGYLRDDWDDREKDNCSIILHSQMLSCAKHSSLILRLNLSVSLPPHAQYFPHISNLALLPTGC